MRKFGLIQSSSTISLFNGIESWCGDFGTTNILRQSSCYVKKIDIYGCSKLNVHYTGWGIYDK